MSPSWVQEAYLKRSGSGDELVRELSLVRSVGDLVVGLGLVGIAAEPAHCVECEVAWGRCLVKKSRGLARPFIQFKPLSSARFDGA